MPALEFYNDNANRLYPFVDEGPPAMTYSGGGELLLPDSAVVDFTVITGLDIAFSVQLHRVYLYEIMRLGDEFHFTFRFTAPLLGDRELIFCRHLNDPEFSQDRQEVANTSASLALPCGGLIVEAWLTTGAMDDLAALLASGEYLRRADGNVWVEPTRLQSLENAFVRTINLANDARTIVPHACSESSEDVTDGIIVGTRCMDGPIKFKEGYNSTIRQLDGDNVLEFAAGVGAGLGEPCGEVPLFPGETPPPGSTLLTGGPTCNEIIKTINGIPGPAYRFLAGRGVSILTDDAVPNRIIIDYNLHGLDVCPPELESESI
jgi:hypothetical protein